MRLLNAIDGVFLGGETVNLLWSLREAHAERAKALSRYDPKFPAWHHRSTPDGWHRALRGVMRSWANPEEPCLAWGWKEVYVGRNGSGAEIFLWLHEVLPDARFLFLVRDQQEILRSMLNKPEWWIPHYGTDRFDIQRKLLTQAATFAQYHAHRPAKTVMADYHDLFDFQAWVHKCKLLGLSPQKAKWQEVLNVVQK